MKAIHLPLFLLSALAWMPVRAHAGQNQSIYQTSKFSKTIMEKHRDNKEVVRQLYEQVLNHQNKTLLPELISNTYTDQNGKKGAEAFIGPVGALISAFPDIRWEIDDLIAEGDKVAVKWHWRGTHTGTFRDLPATGKTILNEGMGIYHLQDGKIVRSEILTDRLGFLEALQPDRAR